MRLKPLEYTQRHGGSQRGAWILAAGILLALPGLRDARAETMVDTEILAPITYIARGNAGSMGVLLFGTNQGAVKGERLHLYRPNREQGLLEIGSAKVDSLTDEWAIAWLRVAEGVDSSMVGDLVEMRLRVPESLTERLTWELARKAITYTNVDGDTLFSSFAVLLQIGVLEDDAFLQGMTDAVVAAAPLFDGHPLGDSLATGRYQGRRLQDILSQATPADLRAYFLYVLSYPERGAGQKSRVEDSFATWAITGGPLSGREAVERAAGLDDEGLKQLFQPFHDMFLHEKPITTWYALARDIWSKEKQEEARAILRVMRVASEFMGLSEWWSYYWSARADIEQWDGNTEAALAANVEAMALAADSTDLGNLYHNRGVMLEGRQDWEAAYAEFQTALAILGALPDTFSTPAGGNTWWGMGRCLHKLERYEEAALAFRTAARLFEEDADLGTLERLASTYSDLGDVYESMGRYGLAIEAWEKGRGVAERLGWKSSMAAALVDVSDGYWNVGQYREAVAAREEAMALYGELGDGTNVGISLTNLGELHWLLAEVDTARACFTRSRDVHEALGETWNVADVLFRQGANERRRANHPAALAQLREAERFFIRAEDPRDVANTRLEMAEACEGLSRRVEADSLYVLAQDGYRREEDRANEARVLGWWGTTLLNRKLPRQARGKMEASLALREEIGDLAGLTDGLRSLSDLLAYQEGSKDSARATAERALAIAEEMPSTPKIAEACLTLGSRYSDLGLLVGALDQVTRAISLFEETGDVNGTARAHSILGWLLDSRGDATGAQREYEIALSLADSADAPGLRARVLGSMAWLLHTQGQGAPAETLARAALEIQERLGNEWETASLYNTLASCADELGRFDESLALQEKALSIRESWTDLFGQSGSHNNIGSTLMRMRDYAGAVPHLERALDLGEEIGYHEVVMVSVANLAECYVELGRGDDALVLMRRSLGLARGAGAMSRLADVCILSGKLHRKLGRLPEARRDLETGLAIADSLGATLDIMQARTELGALSWAEGKPADAVRELEAAVAGLETFRNPVLLWEPLLYLGRARRDAGNAEGAIEAFRRSMTTLESVRSGITDESRSQEFQASHGDAYRELVDILLKQGRRGEAQEVLGLMKAQELRDMQSVPLSERASGEDKQAASRVEGLRSRETVLAQKLSDELGRSQAEQRPELITLLQAQIDSVKLAFHDYVESLRRRKPELYERLDVEPGSFRKLHLKPGEAFVEPLIMPDRVVLFVVRAGSDVNLYRETPIAEARVHSLIREMRERLSEPTVAWESRTAALAVEPGNLEPEAEDPTEPARALDSLLVAPLLGDLDGIHTLIVSPSGPLRYVPFTALYDGKEYLLDRFEVVVLTQAGALEDRAPLTADASVLAFGNPDGSLGGAETEVKELAAMWRPAPVADFYGAEATKVLLRQKLQSCRILHLATHGVLLANNPEGSYLLLAGSDAESHLTLRDILVLPLTGVDLTVLSACQTAMGENGEGREIAGLAYTFEQTGTGSVVASLWNVNDRSTAELMKSFYGNLRAGSMTKAKALREAQLTVRRNPEFAHPYFWAPFILIGNWR